MANNKTIANDISIISSNLNDAIHSVYNMEELCGYVIIPSGPEVIVPHVAEFEYYERITRELLTDLETDSKVYFNGGFDALILIIRRRYNKIMAEVEASRK